MKRSTDKPGKLNLKRETLRQLRLLTLSDDQLRQVAGAWWGDGVSIQNGC